MAAAHPFHDGTRSHDGKLDPLPLTNRDGWWAIALTAAAGLLYFVALGDVPLRDWDEGRARPWPER